MANADSLVVPNLTAATDLVWSQTGGGALLTHTPSGRQLLVAGRTVEAAATLLTGALVGDWVGTPWADTASGFPDGKRAFGLGGNDTLSTDGGNVTLYGGAGNDTLSNWGRVLGNPDTATLYGGAGDDTFQTSSNRYYSATTVSYDDLLSPVPGGVGGANGVVLGSNRIVVRDGTRSPARWATIASMGSAGAATRCSAVTGWIS